MSKSEQFVRLPYENFVALHGQVGNMNVEIMRLQQFALDNRMLEIIPYLEQLRIEVEFFGRYLPPQKPEPPF